ncbi:hypothetical protein AAG570_012043 [Ranatra chinensis]|uniref:Integrase catalytic domain-containing protein n=1 Tax=Ranatra chinensis TaxID=642074 RepID=A0ABD0YHU9_9HEMI
MVRLPFRDDFIPLGNSYNTALKRFLALERRFKLSPEFSRLYSAFMKDYLEQGHMIPAPCGAPISYYIPHHGIFKKGTDKLRVVFDASSASSSGRSLNDALYPGPKLQPLISDIITLFRRYPYVFSCDIEQMFRQISILWRSSPGDAVRVYYLTTVTYGVCSSPYLAIRTLLQLSRDHGDQFPSAAKVLASNTFVDDIITGADTLEQCIQLRDELIALLSRGCLTLKKWASNVPDVLGGIPPEHHLPLSAPISSNSIYVGLLGLLWDPRADTFSYTSTPHTGSSNVPLTKRVVLSQLAQLYDPAGWVSPVVVTAKAFLQSLWLCPVDWDTPLSEVLRDRWLEFLGTFELHGFSDASKIAYGAVVYLTCRTDNTSTVSLLASKTRVAPLKVQTIPRLELLGAVLLANVTCWCDSTVVLHWLAMPSHRLKSFVANRVSLIQELFPPSVWRHVPSGENPADLASRGLPVTDLIQSRLWWEGPSWFTDPLARCPSADQIATPPYELPETVLESPGISLMSTPGAYSLDSISSWPRLLRVVAIILAWRSRIRSEPHSVRYCVRHAEVAVCRYIQQSRFAPQLTQIQAGKPLSKPWARLSPFISDDGLIRAGGRLRPHSPSCPILLPKDHPLVLALIDYIHVFLGHAGLLLLQSNLSRRFWIFSARRVIKSRLHKCVTCFRAKPINKPPLLGDLPPSRVTACPPFVETGMDFAGPFLTRLHHLRKSPIVKTYMCIFICFTTKAVHLELAHDLSISAFLDALGRFVHRRSAPAHLYSDCGTNFVGAAALLNSQWQTLLKACKDQLVSFANAHHISFKFNAPASPHQGGLWERAVRSAKHHLRRVIGTQTPTTNQLAYLFSFVEAVLNSRPITPLSSDPNDLSALTPGHFLVGRPLVAPPELFSASPPTSIIQNYTLLKNLSNQFWLRWHAEYLPQLRERSKWLRPTPNLQPGDLVLLEEANTPPLIWPMGRILKTHPGRDGVVRRVLVQTSSGNYLRPAVKIYRLPLEP